MAPQDPARLQLLTGLVGDAPGARRAFVDATGAAVVLPPRIRRLVATDAAVAALVRDLAIDLDLGQVEPDPAAVAALRPDVIITGAALEPATVNALRRVAPVVAVDTARPAAATADLRALLAPTPLARAPLDLPDQPVVPPRYQA